MLIAVIAMSVVIVVLILICITLLGKNEWLKQGSKCMGDARDDMHQKLYIMRQDKDSLRVALRTAEVRLIDIKRILERK